jgi:hypothetical protein
MKHPINKSRCNQNTSCIWDAEVWNQLSIFVWNLNLRLWYINYYWLIKLAVLSVLFRSLWQLWTNWIWFSPFWNANRALIEWDLECPRLVLVKIKGRKTNLTVISAYPPTLNVTTEAKYTKRRNKFWHVPSQESIVIAEDWNARVGKR